MRTRGRAPLCARTRLFGLALLGLLSVRGHGPDEQRHIVTSYLGRRLEIEIQEDFLSEELAEMFCEQHGLGSSHAPAVRDLIEGAVLGRAEADARGPHVFTELEQPLEVAAFQDADPIRPGVGVLPAERTTAADVDGREKGLASQGCNTHGPEESESAQGQGRAIIARCKDAALQRNDTLCGRYDIGECLLQSTVGGAGRRRRVGAARASHSLLVLASEHALSSSCDMLVERLAERLWSARSVSAMVWDGSGVEEGVLGRVSDADIVIFLQNTARPEHSAVLSAMPLGAVLVVFGGEWVGDLMDADGWAQCVGATIKMYPSLGGGGQDAAVKQRAIEAAIDDAVACITSGPGCAQSKLMLGDDSSGQGFSLGMVQGLGCPSRILFFDIEWGGFGRLNNLLLTLGQVTHVSETTNRTLFLHGRNFGVEIEKIVDVDRLRTAFPCIFTPSDFSGDIFEEAYQMLQPLVVPNPKDLYKSKDRTPDHIWLKNDHLLFYSNLSTPLHMSKMFSNMYLGDGAVNDIVHSYINEVLGKQRRYTAVHLRTASDRSTGEDISCAEVSQGWGAHASTCFPEYDHTRRVKDHAGDDLIFVLSDKQNKTLDATYDGKEDVRWFSSSVLCILVDMEVAVHARTFIGNRFSSFSSNIARIRHERMGKDSIFTRDREYLHLAGLM